MGAQGLAEFDERGPEILAQHAQASGLAGLDNLRRSEAALPRTQGFPPLQGLDHIDIAELRQGLGNFPVAFQSPQAGIPGKQGHLRNHAGL